MAYYGVYKDEGLDDIITSCWHPEGKQFVTTHTDGTIAMWSVDNHERPVKMRKPFGEWWRVVYYRMLCTV